METEYEVCKKGPYMLNLIQMKKGAILIEIGTARKKKKCMNLHIRLFTNRAKGRAGRRERNKDSKTV